MQQVAGRQAAPGFGVVTAAAASSYAIAVLGAAILIAILRAIGVFK